MTRLALMALGMAAAVVLSGCSAPRPVPTPTPTPSASVSAEQPTGDGVLRIGTLFPMAGDVASIGPAMVAAAEIAVRDINTAGGVLEQPVEVLHRDSGDASQPQLEAAFADLVARGVDVVIGPASTALAERLVPLAAEAGVTVITPAATAPTVRGDESAAVLFRSIPADDAQGSAIVGALADENVAAAALIISADAAGRAVEAAVRAALEREGIRVTGVEQVDAFTTIDRLAFSITAGEPEAVIMATGASLAALNPSMLTALAARGISGEQLWLTGSTLADYSATVAPGLLEGARGVLEGAAMTDELAERLRQSDPALQSFRFAPETYDAVVLAALAAVLAGDDGGRSIARALPLASTDGVPCSSFGECLAALETEPAIDYEGLSGPLTMTEAGDLLEGEFGLVEYTAENRVERVDVLTFDAR